MRKSWGMERSLTGLLTCHRTRRHGRCRAAVQSCKCKRGRLSLTQKGSRRALVSVTVQHIRSAGCKQCTHVKVVPKVHIKGCRVCRD